MSLKLDGKDRLRLSELLTRVFDRDTLSVLMLDEFDVHLDQIAAPGSFHETMFNVIEWAQDRGLLVDLVLAFLAARPSDPELQAIAQRLDVATMGLGALDLGFRDPVGERVRVTVDVGPGASFGDLAQILADFDVLASAAVAWSSVERDLGRQAEGDDVPGTTQTTAPPRNATRLGDDEPIIEWLRYNNPIEFVLAGSGAFIALLKFARDWTRDKRMAEAEILKTESEAAKAGGEGAKAHAEARKLEAEAARVELQNELYVELRKYLDKSGFRASAEVVSQVLEEHGALEPLARLAEFKMTVTPELEVIEHAE